jgi:hypothetical protein
MNSRGRDVCRGSSSFFVNNKEALAKGRCAEGAKQLKPGAERSEAPGTIDRVEGWKNGRVIKRERQIKAASRVALVVAGESKRTISIIIEERPCSRVVPRPCQAEASSRRLFVYFR